MKRRFQNVIEPDISWNWVVAFACWLVNLCTNGLLRSQGVLYVALMDSFGVNRQSASWPFSLCIATACFSGLFTGILLQVLSSRQVLFITGFLVSLGYFLCFLVANDTIAITIFYGLVAGFGTGFVTPSLALVTNQYFLQHRATANGISLSGIACGALLYPYLTPFLLDSYGLRGTFLVLGGLALNVFTGASLIRPGRSNSVCKKEQAATESVFGGSSETSAVEPEGYRHVRSDHKGLSVSVEGSPVRFDETANVEEQVRFIKPSEKHAKMSVLNSMWILFHSTVRDPLYHLVSLSALSSIMVLLIFVMIVVDHAVDVGVSADRAPLLLSYFSVPDLIGRLGSGWLTDRHIVRRKTLFAVTKGLSGLVMLLVPWLDGEVALAVLSATLGLLEGIASILTNVLFVEYLGLERLATALSLWSFSIGVVFLTTPTLIGIFRDLCGRYDSMFYLMSGLSLTTAIAWVFEPWLVKGTRSQD